MPRNTSKPLSLSQINKNKQKQAVYFGKIRGVSHLEDEVRQLQLQIEAKLKDSLTEAEIDFKLKERGRPIRVQPNVELDKNRRASFLHTERLRYKRRLFDWLMTRKAKLNELLENLNSVQSTTIYKKDDLESVFEGFLDTEDDDFDV
jgi:hypothetical protein